MIRVDEQAAQTRPTSIDVTERLASEHQQTEFELENLKEKHRILEEKLSKLSMYTPGGVADDKENLANFNNLFANEKRDKSADMERESTGYVAT